MLRLVLECVPLTTVDQDGVTVTYDVMSQAKGLGSDLFPQPLGVAGSDRAASLQQVPHVLWLTGLSGAGKTTIARGVDAELHRRGLHGYVLDGDRVRRGLNSDLGFSAEDRAENIRRVAEVASLMVDAGLIVICSFISPFRADRATARSLFEPGRFLEVYVDAPGSVTEARDPKGLYARARSGQIANFTAVDSPYETPEQAEVHLETTLATPEESVSELIADLERRQLIPLC
jgi:bifunctional enzyme CysN/CysC